MGKAPRDQDGGDFVKEFVSVVDAMLAPEDEMRTFETGATRDGEHGKLDYEGFLSPTVLRRFAEYMHKNRFQRNGALRAGDNWQKGIPRDVYLKSLFRHFMSVWEAHRAGKPVDEEHLCAVLFNTQGYLHELLKERAANGSVCQ